MLDGCGPRFQFLPALVYGFFPSFLFPSFDSNVSESSSTTVHMRLVLGRRCCVLVDWWNIDNIQPVLVWHSSRLIWGFRRGAVPYTVLLRCTIITFYRDVLLTPCRLCIGSNYHFAIESSRCGEFQHTKICVCTWLKLIYLKCGDTTILDDSTTSGGDCVRPYR